jgi:thiol-disulfide isomerase/thioredoxin
LPPLILNRSAAWTAALALTAFGCDVSSGGPLPVARSEKVIASEAGPVSTQPPSAPPLAAHVPAPARTRKLCDGDGNARGRSLPKLSLAHVEASGASPLDGALPPAHGGWTWLNLWAAWCGPCKEEMPRLLSWQDRLARAGAPVRFLFVSLDDDRRQLQDFLDHQPSEGVRSSLWAPEGATRTSLQTSLQMKGSSELPQQVLVDPAGRVRCFVQGAVEEGDYAEILALVAR